MAIGGKTENMGPASDAGRPKYTLLKAFQIVRQMETSSTRSAVFTEIKRNKSVINLVENIYSRARFNLLRQIMLISYMMKCVLSINPGIQDDIELISTGSFENEIRTINRIGGIAPGVGIAVLKSRKINALHPRQMATALRFLIALPSMWTLFGRIAKRYDFMPGCRMASTIGYYALFRRYLRGAHGVKGVLVASNYSPDAVALAAAAHRSSRKVIYANHAHVPLNVPYLPPVLADLAIFSGEIVEDTYRRRSQCASDVSLIGVDNPNAAMSWRDRPETVGIFLTALTRTETIERLIGEISALGTNMRVNIRHHPVSLLHTDLSPLTARYPIARVTPGGPLDDDIDDCDVVICGNSGVALNVLRVGKPAAYCAALDDLPYDYNGFVVNRLVPEIQSWQEATYDVLRRFYTQPEWHHSMTRYDAAYGRDGEDLEASCRSALVRGLDLPASTPPVAFPASDP